MQKAAAFFQLTPQNKGTDSKTQIIFKISGKIGFAEPYIAGYITNSNMLVCILLNEVNCFL